MRKGHNTPWVDTRSFSRVAENSRTFFAKRHDLSMGRYAGKLLGEVSFHVLPKFWMFERVNLVVEQFAFDERRIWECELAEFDALIARIERFLHNG
jgi:hypothetical protein